MAEVSSERDHVDRWLESIRDELPSDLDLTVEGIVDRVASISRRISRALEETLAEQGLALSDYKVLGALRWAGPPYQRSAGELARIAELSSGAMTNRLDKLARAGLLRRLCSGRRLRYFRVMRSTGFVDHVDKKNFAPDIFAALEIAKQHIDERKLEETMA